MLRFSIEKLDRLRARYADILLRIETENTDVPNLFVSKENVLSLLESLGKEEGLEFSFLCRLCLSLCSQWYCFECMHVPVLHDCGMECH